MSKSEETTPARSVGRLPRQPAPNIVSDELGRIMALLAGGCPEDAKISFLFDGRLHALIDVRTVENVLAVEMILPTLGAGMFHDVQRGQAPRHGFGHRVTALVDR